MCGVIGLVNERSRPDLGRVAGELLRTLEYRGYDSTGGVIQGDDEVADLRKGVGAPSVMADKLGITALSGRIFCGQVRWATFGAVDDLNAQPHVVRCKAYLYGAHNGNVTNSDELKQWLTSEGHEVLSDNDGEMVVHAIEHFFAAGLERLQPARRDHRDSRAAVMREAIARASSKLQGSFAAVVVDPATHTAWAIKHGSSLYCGIGRDEQGGHFGIASSDLSSVLKLTRVVVPMVEGEFVELSGVGYQVYKIEADHQVTALERSARRSRLQAADIGLLPPFETFMEQEIAAQEGTVRDVVRMVMGGSRWSRLLEPQLQAVPEEDVGGLRSGIELMRGQTDDASISEAFHSLVGDRVFAELLGSVMRDHGADVSATEPMCSSEAGFLTDLLPMANSVADRLAVRVLDAILERDEVREWNAAADAFVSLCVGALAQRGRIYVVCCGSSYHAARAGALFFNAMAHVELICALPGEFRGQHVHSLQSGDVVLAVSQSGETKDLIDVLNDVLASDAEVPCAALLNNVNSTLGQEKAQVVIPLRCGPEIAVPATKSFMNQVAVFYGLALRVASGRLASGQLPPADAQAIEAEVRERMSRLADLPALLRATLESTEAAVVEAAQLLYLKPSMHLLAIRHLAVAKEGALKIREVVLNHAEGFEGSEFKHGPNTILGRNTVWGPDQVSRLLLQISQAVDEVSRWVDQGEVDAASARRLVQAIHEVTFHPEAALALSEPERALLERAFDREAAFGALDADYPLLFLTGPDERDVLLTVSQINTHKIRGACTVVIAEDNPALRLAAAKPPADNPAYRHVFITLPRTRDTLMLPFTATLVLQRLALKMSTMKMAYLDRLGVRDHGVHPDVPKNVSKSITVD